MAVSPIDTLCLLPDLDGGGAQRTLINLAGAFDRTRIAPRLMALRGGGPAQAWIQPSIPVEILGAARTRTALPALVRALRRQPPQALLATMVDANILAWLAVKALAPRPPLILRETNSHRARGDLGSFRRALIARAYRTADRVVALSEGVRRELIEDYGLDPARCVTLHNPVTLPDPAAPAPPRPAAMPPEPCLVAAGRLTRQKNFPLLLDALAAAETAPRLAILGEGPDRAALEAQAARLGIADRVSLPGFVAEPEAWFAHAAAFVLSSRWEGFGHVIVEAMATGAPVIATDCPHGPRDIIRDGETGLLVPNEECAPLAAAIDRLLGAPAFASQLADVGRAAARRFAPERIVADYTALIEDAVRRP